VIIRAIRDLVSTKAKEINEAEKYILSECWVDDVSIAGFDESFVDIVRESIDLSPVQRKYVVSKILSLIKNPPKKGGDNIALAEIGVTADDSLSQNKSKSNP